LGLPLISAANAEEQSAFLGCSSGQTRWFLWRRKAIFPAGAPRKLLDHVRDVLRVNHYAVRTEGAYVGWIRRFILFHGKKHPREMGALEVELFLTHLAVGENVSSSTQKQALNALVFLYHQVLQKPLGQFRDIERPKRPKRRPLVLSKAEVEKLLAVMSGTHQLIATLLFGTGMRLLECLRLRVKDVDLAQNQIAIRDGKGWKDRRHDAAAKD
jgi:integrase